MKILKIIHNSSVHLNLTHEFAYKGFWITFAVTKQFCEVYTKMFTESLTRINQLQELQKKLLWDRNSEKKYWKTYIVGHSLIFQGSPQGALPECHE